MGYLVYISLAVIAFIIIYRRHEMDLNVLMTKHHQQQRREDFILEYLKHHEEIGAEEVAEIFHTSKRNALIYFKNLELSGKIKEKKEEVYELNK